MSVSKGMQACRITVGRSLWLLMLVLPITFFTVLYLLLEDTEYRPILLKVLIGANIIGYIPFLINTRFDPMGLLFFVVANPATYLALTLAADQSAWAQKQVIANALLGVSAALSVLLVFPRLMAYAIFVCLQCGGCTG
jgi:hypothetical protein